MSRYYQEVVDLLDMNADIENDISFEVADFDGVINGLLGCNKKFVELAQKIRKHDADSDHTELLELITQCKRSNLQRVKVLAKINGKKNWYKTLLLRRLPCRSDRTQKAHASTYAIR